MSAIRLEKFRHPARPNSGARVISDEEIEAIKREAHEAGIREGAAAASEAFSSEQSRCLSRIQEVVGDAFFAREEAHRLALTSLHPLLSTLLDTLAPSLGQTGLAAELSRIVEEAVRTTPEETLNIYVPEGMQKDFAETLLQTGAKITVREDPALTDKQTRIEWNGGFDLIDLDASAAAINVAIDDFYAELNRTTANEVQHVN